MSVQIQLTPGQRERVKELTGRDMEVLDLLDAHGSQAGRMKISRPEDIELLAIVEARRLNDEEVSERKWLVDLAAEQDTERARSKEMDAVRKEAEKETKAEQKRMSAEFELLAAGKKTPRQKEAEAKKKAKAKAAKKAGKAGKKRAP